MQIKPVTKANKPEYPTASEINIPIVLNASKPNKWKRNAAIGAVMVGMALSLNSCIYTDIGSVACIAVSPPVYLSESEAKDIIINELKDNDILYSENNDTTKGITVKLDSTFRNSVYYSKRVQDDTTTISHFIPFDLYLDSGNFALLLISKSKNYKYFDTNDYYIDIQIRQLTKFINDGAIKQNTSLVAFCDPVALVACQSRLYFWEDDDETKALKISKRILRKQVQDFIKWYKENKGKK